MNTGGPEKPIGLYRDPNLQVIFCVTLIAVLGVSSIAPALPLLVTELGIPKDTIGLVMAVFSMPGIFLAPFFGFMSDRFGRKPVLIPSLLLFSLAGTACAFVRDFHWLLVLRTLQGVGAASLGTLNVILIADLYPGSSRIKAMGYNAAVLSLGTAVYPVLGGLLAQISWNSPFFLALLGIPVAGLVRFRFSQSDLDRSSASGLGDYFRQLGESLREIRALTLFLGVITGFILIYGICVTAFPLFMKDHFDSSPASIGIFLSVMSFGTVMTSWRLGRLSESMEERKIILLALCLYILGCLSVPWAGGIEWLILPALALGAANGLFIPVLYTLLSGLAARESRGGLISMNGTFLRLGQTLGPFLTGLIYAAHGLDRTFQAGALLALGMAVLWLGVSGKQFRREKEPH